LKKILVIDILDVLWEIGATGLTIKHVKHPIILLLVLNNGVLIQIKVVPTKPNTHLDATCDRLWHHAGLLLIVALFDFELVIVTILHVIIVNYSVVCHCFAPWISLLVIG
jgi:hypothetical protein